MNSQKIALLETIHPSAESFLDKKFSDITRVKNVLRWQDEIDLSAIQGIITRGKGKVRSTDIEKMLNLQVIARCGIGVDNIDVDFAAKKGVKVINVPGVLSETVAEHTIMMVLNLVRKVVPYYDLVKQGQWDKRGDFTGDDCCGKTLGIIGLGAIGMQVAKFASMFGMKVIYNSLYSPENTYTEVNLDELLAQADVISLHTALTPETEEMVNESFLQKMKEGSYLVNLGRGELVKQSAVLEALNSGELGGFGADVFVPEPPAADDPLIKHPNTLITPHIAALTDRTYQNMSVQTVKNFIAFFQSNLDKRFIVN